MFKKDCCKMSVFDYSFNGHYNDLLALIQVDKSVINMKDTMNSGYHKKGSTAALYACESGQKKVLELLISHDCDLNIPNDRF